MEDAYLIYKRPSKIPYFTFDTLKKHKTLLSSSDILAIVCDKEGLDVVHMGFFIQKSSGDFFRQCFVF